jgi:hypothetical protein
VLATTLGEPSPGYPYPAEWLAQMRAWSRHNLAFGAAPGVLWVGTPTGTLVEIDLDGQRAAELDVNSAAWTDPAWLQIAAAMNKATPPEK